MRSEAYKKRQRDKKRQEYAADPEKFKQRVKQYQSANKDEVQAKNRKWAAANKAQVSENSRRWRTENPERARELKAQWRKANPEKDRAQSAKQYRRHPERYRARKALRRAREVNAAVPLTPEQKAKIAGFYAQARAMGRLMGEPYHVDHIKPLAKGGLHHPDNLQVLRGIDNLKKGAKYD